MSTYEISKSSLLSLKAEILRKQDEVNKSKLENKHKKVSTKSNQLDLKGDKKKVNNAKTVELSDQEYNSEDEDLLKKSRLALEAKSRLYDKLAKTSKDELLDDEQNSRYLVMFDKKSKVDYHSEEDRGKNESEDEICDEYEPAQNSDEEWVEYTDCLGRTRQCLRKDLAFLKVKDNELKNTVEKKNLEENTENEIEQPVCDPIEETRSAELLSSDMRRDLLRQQWEREEIELQKKSDLHYQDLLFNEARTHGVGYYAFSKDEEERIRQQEALKNIRQETEEQQKRAQELRAMREKQLAARAKAARNRKRARMGLPPEEDEPEKPAKEELPVVVPEEKEKDSQKEALERLKEKARKDHIRPWDIGKDGINPKEFCEYSQEEWVEKQRKERVSEFAPPSSYTHTNKNACNSSTIPRRSFSQSGYEERVCDEGPSKNSLFFTTKMKQDKSKEYKARRNVFQKRNENISENEDDKPYQQKENNSPEEPNEEDNNEQDRLLQDYLQSQASSTQTANSLNNPIQNELSSEEEDNSCNNHQSYRDRSYAAIPPPTYENSNSSSKPKRKINTEESIMAGLKFLRTQVEKKQKSNNHPDEMFLM